MINLEEEARKRRERLKAALSGTSATETKAEERNEPRKRKGKSEVEVEAVELDVESFQVPEGQVLLDSTGAEILSLDSKLPDTLEAQVKALLAPKTTLDLNEVDLIEQKDRNSDLKREYERRMTRLNRQTKRAVVDIVRDRLEKEARESTNADESVSNE